MTKEEGKEKMIKKRAGNQAGNRPSVEEEESSKQLEEEKEENMQTGTANEAGNKRGPGRPRLLLLSDEAMEIKREEKRKRDRDYRANKKCKFISLQKLQGLVMEFCEKHGITEQFNAFCEKREEKEEEQRNLCEQYEMVSEALWEGGASQSWDEEIQMILKNHSKNPWATLEENLEMIQTVGLEGVTAVNSNSFGATGTPLERARELKRKREEELDGATRGKRPVTAYSTTPSSEFMAEARQKNHQLANALVTQGPLFSTNKGKREAAHDKEASTSSWASPPHHELGLGSKKEVSMCNLVNQYVKLKDAKRRQQEAAAASIDAKCKFKEKKKEADNLSKQVKGLEEGFSELKAELAEKGKISKDALELQIIDAVTLGWNLMKELLLSMQPGSEFLNLPLLDTIQLYPSLRSQFNEGLTLIGRGHPINDKVAVQSDNPPVAVLRSFFLYYNLLDYEMALEPSVFASLGDAANIAANSPQFQAANTRANNVEQEDDASDQEDG